MFGGGRGQQQGVVKVRGKTYQYSFSFTQVEENSLILQPEWMQKPPGGV